MMTRKALSKRTRFEVFKRDHFTCQYCGKQPPDVVLVIDHITPVCEGGTSDAENLMTACETCNQGKAGIPLSQVPVRPDADLLYLEAQQEAAELRRYQAAKAERDAALTSVIESLQGTWYAYLPEGFDWGPADHLLRSMLDKYSPEIVEVGIIATARAIQTQHVSGHGSGWVKYAWGVMRHTAEEAEEAG